MISDRDIYASASLYIRQHGEKAHGIAQDHAEWFKGQDSEAGEAAFTRIVAAIRELRHETPGPGDRRH